MSFDSGQQQSFASLSLSLSTPFKMSTAEEKKASRSRFEAVFPVIADELLSYMKGEGMPKEAVEWMKTVNSVSLASLSRLLSSSS